MAPPERDETTLRRYLLRTLAEAERVELEAEALRDDAAFERLQAVEDDLFHDYARGGLPDGERRDFERTLLLTPGGARRLEEARAFLGRLGVRAEPRRAARWVSPVWLAAAAVVLAVAAAWLLRGTPAPPRQAQQPSPALPVPSPPLSPAPPAAPASPTVPSRVVSLALSPGLVRGSGSMPRLHITDRVASITLVLSLPPRVSGRTFDAALRSAEGTVVWREAGRRPDRGGATLTLDLPATELPEGDYELVLERPASGGREPVADYPFRLLRD
jgi:hypothetical protein